MGEVQDLLFREYSVVYVTPKAAVSLTLEQWGLMKELKMEGAGGRCAAMVSSECLCGIFDHSSQIQMKLQYKQKSGTKLTTCISVYKYISGSVHMGWITYNSFIMEIC